MRFRAITIKRSLMLVSFEKEEEEEDADDDDDEEEEEEEEEEKELSSGISSEAAITICTMTNDYV
jgi:mRNA deadenylase 3'-5' endonuclease subunit Ccr4